MSCTTSAYFRSPSDFPSCPKAFSRYLNKVGVPNGVHMQYGLLATTVLETAVLGYNVRKKVAPDFW